MAESSKTTCSVFADDIPAISIGMPIFNAGHYLRPAVLSIINQTFSSWELIIIDDASTDGAIDSIHDLKDPRIRVVHHTVNRGLAARLNEAVSLARGKYFARMDQDDISHPERLSRQLRFLEAHPEIDILGTRCVLIDGENRAVGVLEFPTDHQDICHRPYRGILMPHPTWMGKTDWFRANPYQSPGPYFCEDQELLLRTYQSSRFHVLSDTLFAYRVRGAMRLSKLLKTRRTLNSIQARYFLRQGAVVDAAKSSLIFVGKSIYDVISTVCDSRSDAAYAGVPLVPISSGQHDAWHSVLKSNLHNRSVHEEETLKQDKPQLGIAPTDEKTLKTDDGDESGDFISPWLFWLLAFLFCCLQALMVQKLILPLVPSLHAGHGLLINDAIIFHNTASEIAARIRSLGWSQWSLYPPGFSGNVGILSALYAVFGPEPAVFIPLNAAAHVTGALMLYLIGPLLWPGKVGRLGGLVAAILFAAFPSTLLWYSQNHKDAFTIAGALIMLYAWLQLLGAQKDLRSVLKPLLLAALGAVLVLSMRPYLSMMLAAGLILSWIFCFVVSLLISSPWRRNLISWPVACLLVLSCASAFVASTLPASETALKVDVLSAANASDSNEVANAKQWRWNSSTWLPRWVEAPFYRISELRAHFIVYGLSVGAGSGIDQSSMPASTWQALAYFPRALIVGGLVPFPPAWLQHTSAPRLATSGETFIWYLFSGGVLALLYRRPSMPLIGGLVLCAFLIMIYSYTGPNIGTLYRVRFGFWMFLLLCGSVGWSSLVLPLLSRVTAEASANKVTSMERGIDTLAAAGSVALVITFVGFLGFLARDLLLISFRGMGGALDAFFSAAMLPMVFVTCLAMPMADAVTKPFLSCFKAGDMVKAAETIRRFITVGVLATLPAMLATLWMAGPAVRMVLGTADVRVIAQGAFYLKIFAPITLLSVWTVLGNSVLNGIHKSTQAALAQLVVPACAIGAILAVRPEHTLIAGAAGMVVGTALNAALVVILCARNGVWMWPALVRNQSAEDGLQSYIWLVFAAIFTALIAPVNYYFAGTVGEGSVSAWAFASKIVILFNSLFAFGVTAVVLPHLAAKFEKGDNRSGRNHFFFLVVAGTWIGGLVAVALSIFAEPMVYALFGSGGHVTDQQMEILARVLRIGALQVPVAIAGAIVMKSAAISGAAGRAVLASCLGLVANVSANLLLVPALGLEGIAVGALVAIMVSTIFLCISSRERYGTSLSVSAVLLFGWCIWIGFAWAIDRKNSIGLAATTFGLCLLAAVHWISWKWQLHHRTSLRRQHVLPR